MYGQNGIPQRPPPLGDAQAQQQTQTQSGLSGSAGYTAQPPPPLTGGSWQYSQADTRMSGGRSGPVTGAMVSPSRHDSQEVVESRSRQTSKNYYYQRNSQAPSGEAPSVEEVVVPVMLCHTCSHCGQMRSAGFHRNNPVVPGKALVSTRCRRCQKKLEDSHHRSSSRYTRIRKCSADEPCDWPREPFRSSTGYDEGRGRQRTREDAYMRRSSSSRPRTVRRVSSQARLGLQALQQPSSDSRRERTVRASSSSPRPSPRYTSEVWPPPDIVRIQPTRSDGAYPAPPEPLPSRAATYDGAWPPPDIVRTQSYRDTERKSLRRQSSRIIELSPSPPPSRPKVVYRSESQERRPTSRSISPVCIVSRGEARSEEAQTRLMSHPRPFRRVVPRPSDETSSNGGNSTPRPRAESPSYSISKASSTPTHEPPYHHRLRRQPSMRETEHSMHVEVGGPRVHFGRNQQVFEPPPPPPQPVEHPARPRYHTHDQTSNTARTSAHYRTYSRSPPPSSQDYNRIHLSHHHQRRRRRSEVSPPPPHRLHDDEIRIARHRHRESSPQLVTRFEELHVRRNTSPGASQRHRASHRHSASPSPSPSPSPERALHRSHSFYRHVSRAEARLPLPRLRSKDRLADDEDEDDDHTDSGSAREAHVLEVRSYKGVDGKARSASFVRERSRARMLAAGSERGGEYADLGRRERVTRVWRDA